MTTSPQTRIERDTFGPIEVPADKLWGAQTQRSLQNFKISGEQQPREIIARWRKSSAPRPWSTSSSDCSTRRRPTPSSPPPTRSSPASTTANSRWSSGRPGSGTQTNMNMNEVLANRASEMLGGERGEGAARAPQRRRQPGPVVERRVPDGDARRRGRCDRQAAAAGACEAARRRWTRSRRTSRDIVKIGRTHLQDATPLTLGQEFSGYVAQLDHGVGACARRAAAPVRAGARRHRGRHRAQRASRVRGAGGGASWRS